MSGGERPGEFDPDQSLQAGRGQMIVRCQRCGGEATVAAPFSQAPHTSYPDALDAQCEELKESQKAGYSEVRANACAALQRAITAAIGGRDD
jgi:hypothetical protein